MIQKTQAIPPPPQIAHLKNAANDLSDWTNEGEIFSLEQVSWADHAAFAPDAMKWKGKYYFFFPAGFQIGVAVSEHFYR